METSLLGVVLLGLAVAWWRHSAARAYRDAIVRANPPKQLRSAPLLRSGGKVVEATETLRVLARQMREGRQLGVQLSCWFRGEEAISIVSGAYRRAVPLSGGGEWLPITVDTLLHGFSITKGIVAALLLALVDDGVLGYDDRVDSVWPEMHDERIGALTVAELVSHRGGLYISPSFALRFAKRAGCCSCLARVCGRSWRSDPSGAWRAGERWAQSVAPKWVPGAEAHYTPVCWSWVVGGLIRRAVAAHARGGGGSGGVAALAAAHADGGALLRALVHARLAARLGRPRDLHLGFDDALRSSGDQLQQRLARVEPISLLRCVADVSLLRAIDLDPLVLEAAAAGAESARYVATRCGLATVRCAALRACCPRSVVRVILGVGSYVEVSVFYVPLHFTRILLTV